MRDALEARLAGLRRRLRRVERRELTELRRWISHTDNLVHLSVLLFVPLLIGLVTILSNSVAELSFLLFPPLASGTYTLFADPEGSYSNPIRFVGGLTVGAICGWVAVDATNLLYGPPKGMFQIHPESAALAIFLTGAFTWLVDAEEPSAFSTALLVLLVVETNVAPVDYVASVFLSGSVVAITFTVWRARFYERRAEYLYETTSGDDHVLVPMRGEASETTALFGARLAAAHEAGSVVLLDVLDDDRIAAAEAEAGEDHDARASDAAGADEVAGADDPVGADDPARPDETPRIRADDAASGRAAEEAAARLESFADVVRTKVGVPCQVVVAVGDPATAAVRTARETNCDLVVTPYEEERGSLSSFVRAMFVAPVDAVAFRSTADRDRWKRVLVAVSRPGDVAHAMIDFAERLAGRSGAVSVCTCIGSEVERRPAEERLVNLVETARMTVETRVARADVEDFLAANAAAYDLVIVGSSRDRSAASRFLSPPTFERLGELDADVAVVDRARP
ncbi:MAG: HPP family protein [Salinigranum sp.]